MRCKADDCAKVRKMGSCLGYLSWNATEQTRDTRDVEPLICKTLADMSEKQAIYLLLQFGFALQGNLGVLCVLRMTMSRQT